MPDAAMLQVLDEEGKARGKTPSIRPDDLKRLFRAMLQTRIFDTRGMNLQRQGRIGFFVPSWGQEASQIGCAFAMGADDWVYPSYRTHSIALFLGVPLRHLVDQLWGNAKDLTKGRQMPNHFSFRKFRWVSVSSPIGTQISQAAGTARALQIRGEKAVSWAWFGDGGTSSNDFHCGLNFAGVWKAPAIFVCENNHWAISVPAECQTAAHTFADKAVAYGMPGVRVDGNDVLAVYQVAKEARDRAVRGEGPTLVETVTFRLGPHSSSDDPKKYQANELLEEWKAKDPIERFRGYLRSRKLWTKAWEDDLAKEIGDEITQAIEAAESTPPPAVETLFDDVLDGVPPHLAEQREGLLEQIRRGGAIEDKGGAFPL
jgi:2-oxoisovalerate dehydrogenase E1 component alpha subunit